MTENCMDCVYHSVIADPDPHDSFCSDDVAVVCTLMKNDKHDDRSLYRADHSPYKAITVSCRPYNKRKECDKPEWCPK